MTANSWPQDGTAESPATANKIPSPSVSRSVPDPLVDVPGTPPVDEPSTSEVAKNEATDVAQEATDAVQNVVQTTKTEAAHVADEVKTSTRELFAQAKSDFTEQASTQQRKFTEGLRSVATDLQAMASASEQPGLAADLVRQAAEHSSAVVSWLEGKDPGSLLAEVKSFARRSPGTFLLLAAGTGILAGRLTRNLSAGAPDSARSATPGPASVAPAAATGSVVPPVSVEIAATETTAGSLSGIYPAEAHRNEPMTAADRQELWDEEPVVTGPLPPVADPRRQEPLDGGHR